MPDAGSILGISESALVAIAGSALGVKVLDVAQKALGVWYEPKRLFRIKQAEEDVKDMQTARAKARLLDKEDHRQALEAPPAYEGGDAWEADTPYDLDAPMFSRGEVSEAQSIRPPEDYAVEVDGHTRMRAESLEQNLSLRRLANIEAIIIKAATTGPRTVSPDPVDPDWAVRFFDDCKDVSDHLVQSAWAKVLAGEVAEPGTFSRRALRVLRDLSKVEVQAFSKLCSLSLREVILSNTLIPFAFGPRLPEDEKFWDGEGLGMPILMRLQDAGLLYLVPTGTLVKGPRTFAFRGRSDTIVMQCDFDHSEIGTGVATFTTAGQELSRLCDVVGAPRDRLEMILQFVRAGHFGAVRAAFHVEVPGRSVQVYQVPTEG